jgi:Protein of unknown function (DUF1612)/HTH DNA binding domain
MNSYHFDEKVLWDRAVIEAAMRVHDAAIRLDERASGTELRDGWRQRLLFGEACACQLAEGDLVHLEDLVLLDGGAFDGPASIPLASALQVLGVWRKALAGDARTLLQGDLPGEADVSTAPLATDMPEDPKGFTAAIDPHALTDWRHVVARTHKLPAAIAAAVVWDAWLTLLPEHRGTWRAPLLASLMLRARALTTSYLLPIDTGRRFAPYRRHAAHDLRTRILGMLGWLETGVIRATTELDALMLAAAVMRRRIAGRRGDRLAHLVDLFLARPLVSIPMAARHLRVSQQAMQKMIAKLGSTPREMSGRLRYRVWRVA